MSGSCSRARSLRAIGARGFTLIELVVVVLIITVFASLAVPTVVNQMRDRRVQESARRIAMLYGQARLRALGRGAAVMVRFDNDRFSVHQARLGSASPTEDCEDLPVASCLSTQWSSLTQQRVVDAHVEAGSGDLAGMSLSVLDSDDNALTELEICFTPLGRAFVRENIDDEVPFTPMSEAYLAQVERSGAGRPRRVALLPNGTARLSAQ